MFPFSTPYPPFPLPSYYRSREFADKILPSLMPVFGYDDPADTTTCLVKHIDLLLDLTPADTVEVCVES